MKRIQQQHPQASQSPLMCALAIIIHILSHPSSEGQCLCADFHCPNWCAVVKFSVPHTEGQMGTSSQKGVAVTLVRLRMLPSAMQAANSRYPVVALHHQGWHRGKIPGRYAVMAVLGHMCHHVEGCGLLSSLPCQLVLPAHCLVWILWGHHQDRS